ncbi:disintegrin and metalloproteinase domain-containing protein 10-like, partial [Tropilaelaps mercedesae]
MSQDPFCSLRPVWWNNNPFRLDYYEPLYFDASPMRSHARRKRALDERWQDRPSIEISFKAHKRKFRLRLESAPDDVFARDMEVIEDGRQVWYDTASVVHGILQGRADSEVQGVITTEGLFDGVIRDGEEEFFIEPAHRYFPNAVHRHEDHSRNLRAKDETKDPEGFHHRSKERNKNKYNTTFSGTTTPSGDPTFHSVIYKGSDVRFPENASCGSITLDGKVERHPLVKLSATHTRYVRKRRDTL